MIAFIGAGQMAKAMISGFHNSHIDGQSIIVSNPSIGKLNELHKNFNVKITQNNCEAAKDAKYIFIAVKPHLVVQVLIEIKDVIKEDAVIISIAAGIELAEIEKHIKQDVIRIMPNTPCLVQKGAIAFCSHHDKPFQEIKDLLSNLGKVFDIDEMMMSAFIAMAGSSPAYMFMMIEAMGDAGVQLGLNRELAYELASQAMLGSSYLALASKLHPGMLKDQVTSPKGTTIEGVRTLEKHGFRSSVIETVLAVANKNEEMR